MGIVFSKQKLGGAGEFIMIRSLMITSVGNYQKTKGVGENDLIIRGPAMNRCVERGHCKYE